ncbi:MAG: DUF6525 family protein [Pseudomonadota bacterium]
MNCNLGQTSLHRRPRRGDSMSKYDGLPAPLRRWLSDAALPWSPTSVRRIWLKCRAKGMSTQETLVHLEKAETVTLSRDKKAGPKGPAFPI